MTMFEQQQQDKYDAAEPLLPPSQTRAAPSCSSSIVYWNEYPGLRRTPIVTASAPSSSSSSSVDQSALFFLQTGGNALQAFPKQVITKSKSEIISVVIPVGCDPGRTLLVQIPDSYATTTSNQQQQQPHGPSDKWVSVIIPPGMSAGHVLLVEVPSHQPRSTTTNGNQNDVAELQYEGYGKQQDSIIIVMGEPVEQGRPVGITENTAATTTTTTTTTINSTMMNHPHPPNDLMLQEEASSETVVASITNLHEHHSIV